MLRLGSLLLLLVFLQANASNSKVFDHTSIFSREMSNVYTSLQNIDVLTKFKACCINGASLDSRIENGLRSVAQNPVGYDTLKIVSSRVYPYVECANSLERLISTIPCPPQTGNELVKKLDP